MVPAPEEHDGRGKENESQENADCASKRAALLLSILRAAATTTAAEAGPEASLAFGLADDELNVLLVDDMIGVVGGLLNRILRHEWCGGHDCSGDGGKRWQSGIQGASKYAVSLLRSWGLSARALPQRAAIDASSAPLRNH